MSRSRMMTVSERWFRLLLCLYPVAFRDDMGDAVVEAYRDRARDALSRGGLTRLVSVWLYALFDSLRNRSRARARPPAPPPPPAHPARAPPPLTPPLLPA